MADKSSIEWTRGEDGTAGATWNPIVGCSIVSPGCTNCYAMKMAARIEAMHEGTHRPHVLAGGGPAPRSHYEGTTADSKAGAVWTGKVALAPEHILTQPLRWRRGRRIFVNSMGDLFHESVPDEWIDRVLAIMALAPQHTFQILTKRSARMRAYLTKLDVEPTQETARRVAAVWPKGIAVPSAGITFPLPNVWLGVSAEDQRRADERVPDLLATPASVRFVSAEPLLGPLDLVSTLGGTLWMGGQRGCGGRHRHGGRAGEIIHGVLHETDPRQFHHHHDERCGPGIDWVIVGGESGRGARPMHPDWARSIRDQCAAAGVSFFFKQWGSWHPELDRDAEDPDWRAPYARRLNDRHPDIAWLNLASGSGFHGERFHVMRRVGKRSAGRLLDGQEHNGMPGGREVV